MRSALAVRVNGPPGAGNVRLPLHSLQALDDLGRGAPAPRATNQRAIRSKRGHQKAQAPGRDRIAPKCARPIASSSASAIGRQFARIALDEFVERAVDR